MVVISFAAVHHPGFEFSFKKQDQLQIREKFESRTNLESITLIGIYGTARDH